MDEGYIYVFGHYSNESYLKIGRTVDLAERLNKWNRSCYRTHLYKRDETNGKIKVPHVKRVEKIIHTELKNMRHMVKCDPCGGHHNEWFKVNEADVFSVIKKWEEWILKRSYVERAAETWTLSTTALENLENVVTDLPGIKSSQQESGKPVTNIPSLSQLKEESEEEE